MNSNRSRIMIADDHAIIKKCAGAELFRLPIKCAPDVRSYFCFDARGLFRSTQPGILPRHRDVLVVPAKPNVGAIVVTELQRLVLAHGD